MYGMLKTFLDNKKRVNTEKIYIDSQGRKMKVLVIRPLSEDRYDKSKKAGLLWIHGGGFMTGMPEMVYVSRVIALVEKHGITVVTPDYCLSWKKPYPAALKDCYNTLLYIRKHADELNIDINQIMVGGESAGGGLTASLCMLARDRGRIGIACQMPLYPMLDCIDTDTSVNNTAPVWNTRKNHMAWKMYLRGIKKQDASPYASAARQTDYTNLPPAYTFVGTKEPFYRETLSYINNLRNAGIEARCDVWEGCYHAFDMVRPDLAVSHKAAIKFEEWFDYAIENYRCCN